jgi:hypothetical protein
MGQSGLKSDALHWRQTASSSRVSFVSNCGAFFGRSLIKEEVMSTIRSAEQTYRQWSSPILLELKEREHQLAPSDRQALQNILLERRLINSGNPDGSDRRKAEPLSGG